MKRLVTLAAVATLLIAGSASAQLGRHLVATPNATFAAGAPTTTNNDDSCDIGTTPAATLLLPYFEVETNGRATTTFFTITNTSSTPQIAHITIWTDWSFPVLDFNVFLTGYDVQPIDLYDVIHNGWIAPGPNAPAAPMGTGVGTGTGANNTTVGKNAGGGGSVSLTRDLVTGNPNFVNNTSLNPGQISCANLPGILRSDVQAAIQSALTTGTGYQGNGFGCLAATDKVGSPSSAHTTPTTAVGYITVDVAAACNQYLPTDTTYYTANDGILYDNVLTGDYEIINKAVTGGNFAGGSPLVHIRAIPEGGAAGTTAPGFGVTNLPYTFYSRYINGNVAGNVLNTDRRQPLPSVWAARWIQGGAGALNTNYHIWREGYTGARTPAAGAAFATATSCTTASTNSAIAVAEIVRFDEHENFIAQTAPGCQVSPCPGTPPGVNLPETSNPSVTNTSIFPGATFTSGDTGGWMYMNLNGFGVGTPASTAPIAANGAVNLALHPGMVRASQSWVVVEMTGTGAAAGAYGVDFDATWLANGCTGPVGVSNATLTGGTVIGPNVIGTTGGILNTTP